MTEHTISFSGSRRPQVGDHVVVEMRERSLWLDKKDHVWPLVGVVQSVANDEYNQRSIYAEVLADGATRPIWGRIVAWVEPDTTRADTGRKGEG